MTSCFCFSVFLFYFEVLPSRVTCCCSFPPSVWICRPPSSLSTCVLFVISPCVCVSVSSMFHLCLTCYSPVLFPEPPSVSLWYVSCFLVVFRSWLCISVCSRLNWLVFCSCLVLCFSFCAVTLYFWHLALGFWIIYIYIYFSFWLFIKASLYLAFVSSQMSVAAGADSLWALLQNLMFKCIYSLNVCENKIIQVLSYMRFRTTRACL